MDVSVIVPTYREAENLPQLVPRISAALDRAGLRGEILVVDDDSPDDTEAVCRSLSSAHPVRLLVRRGERGLSSAVLHGIREARGAILVVMDADLSHPPEVIPQLIHAIQRDGADFALGSRYARGGSTDEKWSLYRRINSQVARLLARPLVPIRDPLAGFFALSRARFDEATGLDPVGYKIGLELLVRCGCRTVKEVPIHFRDRVRGTSKMTLREQVDYLRHLARLYSFRLRRWIA